MRAPWLVSVVVNLVVHLGGCGDVPITAEPNRGVRETVNTYRVTDMSLVDIALVLEPAEREQARPWVRQLLRELLTGDADGDGTVDHHASSQVRVTVLTQAQLSAFTVPAENPDFVVSRCVRDGSCQPPEPSATYQWLPYGFAPSIEAYLNTVDCLLTADATNCDVEDNGMPWPAFETWVSPVTLADLEATITTLCVALQTCALQIDVAADLALNDVAFDDAGLASCAITETLPASGPITRCDQLTDAGRTLLRVDAAGREVCAISQVATNPDGSPAPGRGFYLYEGDMPPLDGASAAPTASPEFPTTCGVYFDPGRYILRTPQTPFIVGSDISERCTLTTDPS